MFSAIDTRCPDQAFLPKLQSGLHRKGPLQAHASKHRTALGAVRVLSFALPLYMSTFSTCGHQVTSKYPLGCQLRILAMNPSTVSDRPILLKVHVGGSSVKCAGGTQALNLKVST